MHSPPNRDIDKNRAGSVKKTWLRKPRADLHIGPQTTTKTYLNPHDALTEIAYYQQVPWACPTLLDADPQAGQLVIATGQPATIADADGLLELLEHLSSAHIHHRDVWVGNVISTPDGPKLIDWECGLYQVAPSYDLHGPETSGVPIPSIHTALGTGYAMWIGSDHPKSIENMWGTN
ncbi:unnamed protein product [marine sediment metagenome]|uniref:Aminoglycoside phosphotransferase domain-containing protein n=1 Tax=marine sediment metagenome TaxID=412755 RepID=X0TNM1_9ZZZZ